MITEYRNQKALGIISKMQIGIQIQEKESFCYEKTKLFESEFGVCFN